MPHEELLTIKELYQRYGKRLHAKAMSKRAEKAGRSKAEQALFEIYQVTDERWEVAFPGDSVSQFRKVLDS